MFYLLDISNRRVLTAKATMQEVVAFIPAHFLQDTPGLVVTVDTNTANEIAAIGYFRGKHEQESQLIHS